MIPSSSLMRRWLATSGPLLLEGCLLAWTLALAPTELPSPTMDIGVYGVLAIALAIVLWHLALIILRRSTWPLWVSYAVGHLGLVFVTGFWSYCLIRFGAYL